MNIYFLIFLFLLILFWFEDRLKKYPLLYNYLKIIMVFIIILLVGLRGMLGADTSRYSYFFDVIPKLSGLTISYLHNSSMESGYLLLNSIVKTCWGDVWLVFFIFAFVSLINIAVFINYFSSYFFYSLCFYYSRWLFLKEFNQIRNGIASSFLYIGFIYLHKKKYKSFVVCVLIGSLFHISILFGLTILLFIKLNQKKKFRKIFVFLTYILPFINLRFIFDKILIKILGSNSLYINGQYGFRQTAIASYYSMALLLFLFIVHKRLKKSKQKLLIKLFSYSVFVNSVFFTYGDIGGRLSSFFNVEFVLQSEFLTFCKKGRNRLLIKILLILFMLLLFKINFIDRVFSTITPYRFFWEI